jgi:eukaryotic-like serine/threonine-protein kinase
MTISRDLIKKILKILGVIFLFLYICYVSLNIMMSQIIHTGKQVIVPNLIGSSLESAHQKVMENDLYLAKDGEQYNSNIPSGSVVSQSPLPGTTVKSGKKIKVIISTGTEKIKVPNLVGVPERKAEIILRQSNLGLGDKTEGYSASFDKGLVIMHDPPTDANVEKGTPVNLLISKGLTKHGALMPDFIGARITYAEIIIKAMGLSIKNIATQTNDTLKEGTIISQTPPADKIVNLNDTVDFVISVPSQSTASTVKEIYFEVSQGLLARHVRISVKDDQGEREVYNTTQEPGSKIDISVPVKGKAKASIYVNEILVEERDL